MSPPGKFAQLQEFWIIFKNSSLSDHLCVWSNNVSNVLQRPPSKEGKSSQLNAHLQTSSFSRPICRNNLSPFPRHNPHFLTDLETMAPMYLREKQIKILCIMDIVDDSKTNFQLYCVHNDFYFVNEAPLLMRELLLRKLWIFKINVKIVSASSILVDSKEISRHFYFKSPQFSIFEKLQ